MSLSAGRTRTTAVRAMSTVVSMPLMSSGLLASMSERMVSQMDSTRGERGLFVAWCGDLRTQAAHLVRHFHQEFDGGAGDRQRGGGDGLERSTDIDLAGVGLELHDGFGARRGEQARHDDSGDPGDGGAVGGSAAAGAGGHEVTKIRSLANDPTSM